MAEKFEVIIGAVDNASPVLQKFNQHLQTVQTTSQKAVAGLQSMADKSKWAFAAMSGAIVGAVKVFADFEHYSHSDLQYLLRAWSRNNTRNGLQQSKSNHPSLQHLHVNDLNSSFFSKNSLGRLLP